MKGYLSHSAMTDPGRHGAALREVADQPVADLVKLVQGLLVHGDHLEFYDLTSSDVAENSRTTLSVADRLTQLALRDGQAPLAFRQPTDRAVGTCRDFALMTCALLREASVPARVRCGFATYFAPSRYEDHWVTEYWSQDDRSWHLADAQLDSEHRSVLGIAFAPHDLPAGTYVNAAQAWRMVRSGKRPAEDFGHGDAVGEWFLRVNLVRDLLSLRNQETSEWDGWRSATEEMRRVRKSEIGDCDRIADVVLSFESGAYHRDPVLAAPPVFPYRS